MAALAGAVAAVARPPRAGAQAGGEGLFVLLPVGARAVGMGEAVVAQRGGSDALWWNPAAVAGPGPREAALHHSETVLGRGNALALVWPVGGAGRFGTIGTSVNVLDLGQIQATDEQGQPVGVIFPTDYAVGLTYSLAPTPLLALGATVKHVELRYGCSGLCAGLPQGGARANGADVGAQLRLGDSVPLTVGVAARNLGIGGPGARAGRLDVGAEYRIAAVARAVPGVRLDLAGGVVSTTALDSTSYRIGSDVVLDERIHVRAGYIRDPWNGSGAAVGLGLAAGKLVLDLARTFGGLSADGGKPPTYFSLRYVW